MELRPARPEDALAVARVHVRCWQIGYRGLLPDGYLDGLRAEDRAPRYTFEVRDPDRPHTIVADDGGAIVGFATTMPAPGMPGTGELAALHVDPDAWRRGIGTALIGAARARLDELGFGAAVLWLLVGNRRAEQFYAADGWTADGTRRTAEVWGAQVDEVLLRRALPGSPGRAS
jgi:GNAT superfamily N-acetyltransferase